MLPKNVLIGQRIILGFSAPLFALLALGVFTMRNLDDMREESAWVTHTMEVMSELRVLTDAVSSIESTGRGYVIAPDSTLKDKLAAQRVNAAQSLQRLKVLTVDNSLQQTRLERMAAFIEQRGQLSSELVRQREAGTPVGDIRLTDTVRRGQEISESIHSLSSEMIQTESDLLNQRRSAADKVTEFTKATVIYGSLGSLIIVIISGLVLSRSITRPLAELRRGATRIGEGDYQHRVPIERDDEVGHLARVFNTMGQQVYERQTALANEDWLKTAVANFTKLTQQQRDPKHVTAILLNDLAATLHAYQSVAYTVHTSASGHPSLEYCAGYAAENPPVKIAVGEGLVGQCLAEKRRITVTTPPDYLRIGSALGGAKPATIIVEPVLFEGQIKAVIELASFEPFTTLQLSLIGQLATHLGVVLQTIEAVNRTEQLLAESQALTRQLERQQQALAEQNRELEEQSERLRKSEQQLQDQQVELEQSNEELEQSNEELQQSNEEMEEKSNLLAQQKRDLEASNKEIEQARIEVQEQARQLAITSKYKSDFLATMSHELRTPLNSLLILARLLAENRDKNLSNKQVEFAKTIESSGADLLEMINQILDLAKIESGTVELQVETVALREIHDAIEQQFRHVAEQKKLNYEVTLSPDLPPDLQTDGRRLNQVLRNLLSNAFKFTERGSVKVNIRPVKEGWKRRSETLAKANGVIAVSISDSGIGIPKEKQDIIFESFQQVDAGTSRRFGGTGLGLSISRELTQLLGGVLQLDSSSGEGSTFTLFLPVALDPKAMPQREVAPPAPVRAPAPTKSSDLAKAPAPIDDIETLLKETEGSSFNDDRRNIDPADRVILVVEDDVRFANILVDFAREKGFKVIVAESARQALAMATHFIPVAITLDLRLVDEDGWVVLDRLKHDKRTRHIPVHVISVDPARGRGLRLGAVSYLQKPVSKDAIQAVLQQTVDFLDRPVKNLLVVEDDPTQRSTIRELIGNGDVKTTTVGTAAEALAELERQRYDCIVLDLMLPDKPGAELIREINRRLGLQAPPVIVYTGKDLSPAEETELRSLSESIIVKDARSPERLLDETALFLHRVENRLPESKRRMLEQVRRQDSVLTGRRVLVVDDDARNIFALTAALETYGMTVRFAESGKAAIETLNTDPHCDVVLMDVMMPEMDGYEAIRRLRRDNRFARLPIISLTAKAMKGDRERCIEAGASDYITKPVDTEKLLSLLRVWLYR